METIVGKIIVLNIALLPVIVTVSLVRRRRKKRARNFSLDSKAEAYTCPICHMSNDKICVCERCGFNPVTKEGNVAYDDADVNDIVLRISRGV